MMEKSGERGTGSRVVRGFDNLAGFSHECVVHQHWVLSLSLSYSYSLALSFSRSLALALCCSVALLLSRSVALSLSHPFTLVSCSSRQQLVFCKEVSSLCIHNQNKIDESC